MVSLFRRTASLAVTLALLAACFIAAYAPASACNKTFRVYNDTDTAIERLYVAPTEASTWEDDVLGDGILDAGYNKLVDMSSDTRDLKLYDVKAVFSNGQVVSGGKIPICSAVHVHIHAGSVTYTT